MTLLKLKSNSSIFNLLDDVETMVGQAFGSDPNQLGKSIETVPLMNIIETGTEYVAQIKLPGVDKKQLTVDIGSSCKRRLIHNQLFKALITFLPIKVH